MKDKSIEDKKIIKYIKKCDQRGMEMLIDKYTPILKGVIRNHISSVSNYEEECLSDVLFLIWENIERFKSKESSFKNWICAIAKYKAIDYKRKYISKLSEELDTETSYIDENLQKLEIEQEIEELLQFLNDKDRELFKRYYLSGDKLEEIAFDNKTNVTNLHSRLSRGRKKIRKHILK